MQQPGSFRSGAPSAERWSGPWDGPPPQGWNGHWGDPRHHSAAARRGRLWFPIVFSLLVQLPSVFVKFDTATRHPVPLRLPADQFWPDLVLAIIGPLALILARRYPGPVVAFVSAAAALDLFVVSPDDAPLYVSLAFAIIFAVARGARVWAWASVGGAWIVSISAAIVFGTQWSPVRIALTTLGVLIVFGLGESTRNRAERFSQIARIRAQRRQSEIQAERVRIARELHDVLAHSLSQINVQAGVGLHLMDSQPEKARDALASIKDTSKSALAEVRSVLGVLRSEGGGQDEDAPLVPEPDLSRIDWLAASVSSQGIEVSVAGMPGGVPQATQLAMFRIVQESLTNIVRHAKATRASITFGEETGFYTVTITDNGSAPPPTGESEGRGLLGMRERAELLGGTLDTGPLAEGGFRVSARIPTRGSVDLS
jgi:signal transduction histidine kinase